MPRVACPSCAKAYEVTEQSLGGRAQCKSCGETFTLSVARDETFSQSQPAGSGSAPLNAPVLAESGLVAGNQLGHYVLKKKLGAGGMGEVWLARDPHLERDVALKVLPVAIAHDDQRRERFAREARLAARLHHPNAVIVYQFGLEEQQVFIAMELVDGQSLDQVVQENGPLDWREATQVICDAARGLAAAHEIGLVHRDIKPGNLMRTSKGETKVVDFGLAREQVADTQFTQEGMTLGTPAYMAPEQWANENVDGRTDLYSLICTYYFLLTGALPFEATNFAALGYQHRYEPLPDPRQLRPDLPDRVTRILSRGAEKEPGDRYQTAEELIADLETLLEAPDQPVTARSSLAGRSKSLATHAHKKVLDGVARVRAWGSTVQPRKRWIIAACSAALFLLLLGIVVLVPTSTGTVKIEIDDPKATAVVDNEKIAVEGLAEPIELRTGEHELIVRRGDVVVETRNFTIVEGEKTVVKITLLEDGVASAADAEATVQKPPPEPVQGANAPKPVPGTNESPVLPALADQTVIVGDELTMNLQASDPDDEDAALGYSLLRQPIGATINPTTGELRWTPTDAQAGQKYQMKVRVEDNRTPAGSDEKSFMVTVRRPNRPPTLAAPNDATTEVGEELRLIVRASDPDGTANRLRFSLLDQPADATIDPRTGEFRWTPNDTQADQKHQVTVRVQDDGTPPGIDEKSFMVTVTHPKIAGQEDDDNFLKMKLCWIPAGEFQMGSPKAEDDRGNDEEQHRVRITKPFYLGKYEVTQAEFEKLMGFNPSRFDTVSGEDTGRFPVEPVTWYDAVEFCNRLSERDGLAAYYDMTTVEKDGNHIEKADVKIVGGRGYRLPTEAEWEYACRAGTTTPFHFGSTNNGTDANVDGNSPYGTSTKGPSLGRTTTVGSYAANPFGLHDMHGNVWEWCQDWYDADFYSGSPTNDPVNNTPGTSRVLRGGSWNFGARYARSAFRIRYTPDYRFYVVGFRLARTP